MNYNDYMMNWPYFCNETSSKSTVTNSCQKVSPLHPNLGHFWRPPIAHSIDEQNNDYMMNQPYFCNETSSKDTVTNRCQIVWPLHPNLGHFWRPPFANMSAPCSKICIALPFDLFYKSLHLDCVEFALSPTNQPQSLLVFLGGFEGLKFPRKKGYLLSHTVDS